MSTEDHLGLSPAQEQVESAVTNLKGLLGRSFKPVEQQLRQTALPAGSGIY